MYLASLLYFTVFFKVSPGSLYDLLHAALPARRSGRQTPALFVPEATRPPLRRSWKIFIKARHRQVLCPLALTRARKVRGGLLAAFTTGNYNILRLL